MVQIHLFHSILLKKQRHDSDMPGVFCIVFRTAPVNEKGFPVNGSHFVDFCCEFQLGIQTAVSAGDEKFIKICHSSIRNGKSCKKNPGQMIRDLSCFFNLPEAEAVCRKIIFQEPENRRSWSAGGGRLRGPASPQKEPARRSRRQCQAYPSG